jgi:tetratricopeptide (TPR) repeat protein
VLAIGFLGDYSANALLGRALQDKDRVVRLLAETNIRELWRRDGSEGQQQQLATIIRLNGCDRFDKAARESTRLIREADWFAEAWNQRAIAYFRLERFSESLRDCRQTLSRNPYHFATAIGMGHCYLEMCDGPAALECFRQALQLNPDMEHVRAQIDYLQRALDGN